MFTAYAKLRAVPGPVRELAARDRGARGLALPLCLSRHERFDRLACVGRYVGVGRVDRLWVRLLVAEPMIYDRFRLQQFPDFAACKLTLVHVFALLFVLCLALHPSVAFAEVQWVSKDSSTDGYRGFVYPHSYSEDGRWAAFAEVLGFNWYSFSSEVKANIRSIPELSGFVDDQMALWNIAYGVFPDVNPDWLNSLSDWAVELFGGDTIYAFSLSSADYDFARGEFEYWAYPRVDPPVSGTGQGSYDFYLTTYPCSFYSYNKPGSTTKNDLKMSFHYNSTGLPPYGYTVYSGVNVTLTPE